jgi:hypothetical protein
LSIYGGDFPAAKSVDAGIAGLKTLVDHCALCACPNLLLGGTDIILFGPGLGWRCRREHFAAGVAAELLHLMDQRAHGRLSTHADRHRRLLPPP